MYSVMWSEHCSYKSSTDPPQAPPHRRPSGSWSAPVRTPACSTSGDGIAAAIRIESHNHPSAIEPYQGAATGAGGHPARHLHHGRPAHRPHGPASIRSARRCPQPLDRRRCGERASPATATRSGVPTVGGETVFDPTYRGEPPGQRALSRPACPPIASCSARPVGGRQPRRAARGRPPDGTASAGSACWPRRASTIPRTNRRQATQRAGRRPLSRRSA